MFIGIVNADDTTTPIVTLVTPVNDSNLTSLPITFTYTAIDNETMNCSLILNDAVTQVDYTIINGTNTFSETSLSNGDYVWYTICVDTSWNVGNATSLSFNLNVPASNSVIDEDMLEGLPQVGTDTGTFLGNLAPGLGKFILIMGVFVGIVGILAGIISVIKTKINFKK